MKKYLKLIGGVFVLMALMPVTKAQTTTDITISDLKQHIYFLASDSLKGRKPGTPEAKVAADYIRDQFVADGLQLLGDNGFQYFDVTVSVEPGTANAFVSGETTGIFDSTFQLMPFTLNGTLDAEVVFAGFGLDIAQDSLQWNDYEGIDVTGKWVMVLRGDPEPDNEESVFANFGSDRDKALTAKDHHAAGILFVNGPQYGSGDQLMPQTFNRVTAGAGMMAINISQSLANQLLIEKNLTISRLEDSIRSIMQPISFQLKRKVKATTDLQRVEVTTCNVVAMIPGSDPLLKDEYVVIGGHYDHLGFGGDGSGSRMPDTIAIHNGADDNASGVAAVLELAQWLSSQKEQLKRSVIFMAFGGEEMGLLGSQFFASNPLVSIKQVKMMLNFDMIGRLDAEKPSLMIGGTGTAVETEAFLKTMEEGSEMGFTHSPEGYGASDHASFYGAGVPVLFFFTGAHQDYHTPFDDADNINYEGEQAILDFAVPLIFELVNRTDALVYQETEAPKQEGRNSRTLKVKLGIMPDFTNTENNGLGVGGVTAGGPASAAGMKKGDRITSLDGMEVTNIYDYMARLKKLKPGQRITVDIVRDGQKQVLIVAL
ncbi:MAG: M20/M25/M40 family metallo-hydrolase [Bacteroidetes bacterium]|nr:M20/M25/M40 family metallo-hydrolase [Bacteroidota bacterium]